MTARVGLTGGIGSGKSTVASLFADKGILVIDADQVARELTRPGTPALDAIGRQFGYDLISESGELDRAALGKLVFSDRPSRHWLESLLHPLIRENMSQRVESCSDSFCILEIPLLVESGQVAQMDRVIVVQCPREERIQRLVSSRGISRDHVEKIIAQQATDEERRSVADFVVDNAGHLNQLADQVDVVISALRAEFG